MSQWIAVISERFEEVLRRVADLLPCRSCECGVLSQSPCIKEFARDNIRVRVREVLHDCGHFGYWTEVLYVLEQDDHTQVSIGLIRDTDLHTVAEMFTKAAEYLDQRKADSPRCELIDD